MIEPKGKILERKTLETFKCYNCRFPGYGENAPGEKESVRGILKQEVKTSTQPKTTVYHCGIGCDDCRELQEYVTQQEIIEKLKS